MGFSLIELLIAMALGVVLMSLAVTAFNGVQARRAVDAAVAALFSDLALARAEAIRRGNFVTICQSSDGTLCSDQPDLWHKGWLLFEGRNPPQTAAPGPTPAILRVQPALAGVRQLVLSQGLNQKRLSFAPTGVGLLAGGNFVFTAQADAATVRLVCISGAGLAALRPAGTTRC